MSIAKYQKISPLNYQYDEKRPMVLDIDTYLPSTPSSSALSFSTYEKEDIVSDNASYFSSESSQRKSYGSIDCKSTATTTNADEGLYLLLTHQLLKERGYEPSPLKQLLNDDDDNDDSCSIESSLSNLSAMDNLLDNNKRRQKESGSCFSFPAWFPFC